MKRGNHVHLSPNFPLCRTQNPKFQTPYLNGTQSPCGSSPKSMLQRDPTHTHTLSVCRALGFRGDHRLGVGGQNLATGPGESTYTSDSPLSGDSEDYSRSGNLFCILAPGLPKSTARGELGPHRAPVQSPKHRQESPTSPALPSLWKYPFPHTPNHISLL